MVKELNDSNFESEVANQEKPMLVDFWASWCAPCRMQSPIIDELDQELSDKIVFAKVNVDENMQISSSLNIASIPTLLIYKEGKIVEKLIGLTTKAELSEILIKLL